MFGIIKHRVYNRKICFIDEFNNTVIKKVPYINLKTGKIDMVCFEEEPLPYSHHTEGKQKFKENKKMLVCERSDWASLVPRMLKEAK